MNDVVIVSAKEKYFHLFGTQMGYLPVHFSRVSDLNEAVNLLSVEKPSHLIFVNEDFNIVSDWVQTYRQTKFNVPFLCCTSHISLQQRKELWEPGAIEIISLPMNRKEFEYILKTLFAEAGSALDNSSEIRGRLDDYNLIDLIQTFEDAKRNGVLFLQKGAQEGRIEFNKGNVANARLDDKDPLEALEEMATWFNGQFWAKQDREKHLERIKLDNQQVILDCLNHINTQQELLNELPDKNLLFFAAPGIDYEEIGPYSRNILLLFKEGNSIAYLLENYSQKTIPMLKKIKECLEKGWLLNKEEFEKNLKPDTKDQVGGLKKFMKKVFGKKENDETKTATPTKKNDEILEEKMLLSISKRPHLFRDLNRLREFAESMEKTV